MRTVSTPAGIFVSGLNFNMSQVIKADTLAGDGVVHNVDKVLFPCILSLSLYDCLIDYGEYTTLVSLLDSTGLALVVKSKTMTFLAPLNSDIPPIALDAYNLTKVLLTHNMILDNPLPLDSSLVDG
jgi:hypothetical protein